MPSSFGHRRSTFGIEHNLIYGRYKEQLAQFAKKHASTLTRSKSETQKGTPCSSLRAFGRLLWKYTFGKIGDDWPFLALLGILLAILSFLMDYFIHQLHKYKLFMYEEALGINLLAQYLAWSLLPLFLILFATAFSSIVSIQSIGSGIPEMKVIFRGVVLEEYLTFRTLVAKIIGLTCTLGSGLHLGKEGPFVHVASIVASLFSRLMASFQDGPPSASQRDDMLAAGCAVGVAATFFAPIGGVLFSIEVTSVYFAVRNYWRGFFSACFGATIWRLFAVWFKDEESLTALNKTAFRYDVPFDPLELIAYAFLGIIAGFGSVAYVKFHRAVVHLFRDNAALNAWFKQNRFLYPGLMTIFLVTLSFPPFLGQFMASTLSPHHTLEDLFSNISWTGNDTDSARLLIVSRWSTESTSIYVNLFIYVLMTSFMAILATTIPVPSGTFIPVFKIGAALGRLFGELMVYQFPTGIPYGDTMQPIISGGYAVVGAAAFSGAVTQTISTSVIAFELTGQMTHMLPVIIAVLIANAISQSLELSIYDSMIEMKQLPFLPTLAPTSSAAHHVAVEEIMTTKVRYISRLSTYLDIRDRLVENPHLRYFPLVDNALNMLLIGSIQRCQLERMIEELLSEERTIQVVKRACLFASGCVKGQRRRNQSRRNAQILDPRATLPEGRFAEGIGDNEDAQVEDLDQMEEGVANLPTIRVSDLSAGERQEWEEEQLDGTVNYGECTIDPAPFQLVERTTLFQVHSLFSMMRLERAYVTSIGRLVGVVALKDLRIAIEKMNAGLRVRKSNSCDSLNETS